MFSFISELHAMLQKSGYNLHCDAEVILPFLLILYNLSKVYARRSTSRCNLSVSLYLPQIFLYVMYKK